MRRRLYNGKEYFLDEEKQVLSLSSEYHKKMLNDKKWGFKKFGGSSIGDVLLTDQFKSQFNAFCHISRLSMPILYKKYINAGKAIEPKIFELLKNKKPNLDIKHIRAEDYGYDYFKGKDEILGGVPDGLIPSKKYVLEMKTTNIKKKNFWEKDNNSGIPIDYRKQAQLYAYLLNYSKFAIVACFLNEEDYENPEDLDIKTRPIETYAFKLDKDIVEGDIKTIKDFYLKYTQSGISPQYKLPLDQDLVEYLKCKNNEEWRTLFNKWKKAGKIDEDEQFDWY